MFTVKIRRQAIALQWVDGPASQQTDPWVETDGKRTKISGVEDETVWYLPADTVKVLGMPDPRLDAWAPGDFKDLRSTVEDWTVTSSSAMPVESQTGARLIEVVHGGESSWFLVSQAWLLNAQGDTVERLAP